MPRPEVHTRFVESHWLNLLEHAERSETLSAHRSRGAAIDRGRALARRHRADHVIHSREGRFLRRDAYSPVPLPPAN